MEMAFEQWVRTLVTDLGVQVIAIDGKKLKGSYDRNHRHSRFTRTPRNCRLYCDPGAMGTQKTIAAQIQAANADYILDLKAKPPTLFNQIKTFFERARAENTLPPQC
jgi:hypothetical protein